MVKSVKNPKVFGVQMVRDRTEIKTDKLYTVEISMGAVLSLPEWLLIYHLRWAHKPDQPRRCIVYILGKDELQACTRFRSLWAGLPKNE